MVVVPGSPSSLLVIGGVAFFAGSGAIAAAALAISEVSRILVLANTVMR
jgi:hypothetical protein